MRIFILSDLHITENHVLCTFGWDSEEFIAKMESIRHTHGIDKVILNGDVFDLYKSNYKKIVAGHPALMKYLKSIDAVFIKGNHDKGNRQGREWYKITNSRGEKIHIEHGHQADFINGTLLGRGMSRMLHRTVKAFSRYRLPRRWYFRAVARVEGFSGPRKTRTDRHIHYAMKLLNDNDVVILGHTHKIGVHHAEGSMGRKKYCNTGACSFGRMQGIILNTETLQHATIQIEPRGARPAGLMAVKKAHATGRIVTSLKRAFQRVAFARS